MSDPILRFCTSFDLFIVVMAMLSISLILGGLIGVAVGERTSCTYYGHLRGFADFE